MGLLQFIDRFSFKQILSIAIILAIVFAVPTTVWLVSQQTRLYSAAHRSNLPPELQGKYEIEPFGQPSANPPKITNVRPFLGKVDDVILIEGQNLGQNPRQRSIFFGSLPADEQDILRWHDDLIEVMVPAGASSGFVKVVEVDKEDTWALPFTVYNTDTKTRVYQQGNNIALENGFDVVLARVVLKNGQVVENKEVLAGPTVALFTSLSAKDIASLALYNRAGQFLPFWVNPIEFGF